jgi:hypothetical protein
VKIKKHHTIVPPDPENNRKRKHKKKNCLIPQPGLTVKVLTKKLEGVKIITSLAKCGNFDEKLLNRVISVKKVKIRGKKWKSL